MKTVTDTAILRLRAIAGGEVWCDVTKKRTLGLLEWDYSITAGLNPSPFHSGDKGRLNNWFSGWLTLKTEKKWVEMKWTVWGWMDWNAEYSRVDKSHLHGQNVHGGLKWDSWARKRERGLKWEERAWSLQASKKASGTVRVAEKKEDGFTKLKEVLCCREAGKS